MTFDMRSQAAIIGIGVTDLVPSSLYSPTKLAAQALKAALNDAGALQDEVDGLVMHTGVIMGVDYDNLVPALGLNLRHVAQYWTHGRWVTQTFQNAALAVATGLADVVACVLTLDVAAMRSSYGGADDAEGQREAGGPHGQAPAFGLTSPAAGAALAARRYFDHYGASQESLMAVVRSARAHAARRPTALRPHFDADAYLAEPMIMDPIRDSDCADPTDIAVVVLITSAERAKSYAKAPIYLRGMQSMRSGREEFIFGPRSLGVWQQAIDSPAPDRHPRQAFEMAGLRREDIDAVYTYDAFSPLVLYVLERFGHCEPGQAARFVMDGHIAPGGRLPLNTSGGMLGEGYACGWHSIVEIVRQLRGEAEGTQLERARHLQWATNWGDSIVFGREP